MAMIGSKVQHNQGHQAYQANQGSDRRRINEGAIVADICRRLQVGIIVEKIHEFSLLPPYLCRKPGLLNNY